MEPVSWIFLLALVLLFAYICYISFSSYKFKKRVVSTPWSKGAIYCEQTFGCIVNWDERYFVCPECDEPIYECDWAGRNLENECPICGFNWYEDDCEQDEDEDDPDEYEDDEDGWYTSEEHAEIDEIEEDADIDEEED